jgi:hypothetical protein
MTTILTPTNAARMVPSGIVTAAGLGFVAAKLDKNHPVLGSLALASSLGVAFHSVAMGYLLGRIDGGARVLDALDQAAEGENILEQVLAIIKGRAIANLINNVEVES